MLREPRLITRTAARVEALRKADAANKYDHGHALILSGPMGKGGAARLAARGALRIGAGLVTVACPPEAMAENAAQLNAIMLTAVQDGTALARILTDPRINALCLGPGMGQERSDLVATVLAARRATVLDADALTVLAQHPPLFAELHSACVLTPHGGEFARLFPEIAEKLRNERCSKAEATSEAAAMAGCVVLFKGPQTVIAAPNGHMAMSAALGEEAAPWLATAGAGDVLAGFITGLLARGHAPIEAAETGTWLHAEVARRFGPGLISEDLPEGLPAVLRDLAV